MRRRRRRLGWIVEIDHLWLISGLEKMMKEREEVAGSFVVRMKGTNGVRACRGLKGMGKEKATFALN